MVNLSEKISVPPPAAPISARKYIAVIVVIIGLCLLAGLVPRWRQKSILQAQALEQVHSSVNVVSPQQIQAGFGLPLPGEIKPIAETPIYARASGYLKSRCVDIGSHVTAGQLLAEIDTPELNHELAQSRAQLAQAEAALDLAKTTAERWAELVKTDSVSEQESAEKQSDFALKSATVQAARANVFRLEDLQSFTHITAPFDGIITARAADVGQLITAGSNKELFHLAQLDRLRIYVRVPQTMSRGVGVGQMAELSIPELPGKVFPAKVVRTAGAMDAQSRTLLSELEVNNSNGEILAGSYAQVRFTDLKSGAILTLPSNTLLFRAEGAQVGVVISNNLVELRNVVLGRDFGTNVEVISGVVPVDRVILNPSDSLVAGIKVNIKPLNPGTAAR